MKSPIAQTLAGLVITLALTMTAWVWSQQQTVQAQVTQVATVQAATAQQVQDIDARTSRIENKLDTIISQTRN